MNNVSKAQDSMFMLVKKRMFDKLLIDSLIKHESQAEEEKPKLAAKFCYVFKGNERHLIQLFVVAV